MILTQLYNKKENIEISSIPNEWKESFEKFMYGQTYYIDADTGKEMAYYSDYARWYFRNKKAIIREEKIDQIKN
jgi:hypothetical protein